MEQNESENEKDKKSNQEESFENGGSDCDDKLEQQVCEYNDLEQNSEEFEIQIKINENNPQVGFLQPSPQQVWQQQEQIQQLQVQQVNNQEGEQQQQQQQQQGGQEGQNQMQNEQDAINNIQEIVSNLNNEIFLNDQYLEGLIQLLMLDKETQLDEISLEDPNLEQKLDFILKQRQVILQNTLGLAINSFDQKVQQGHMNNIEKVMGILKSKKKQIYLIKNQNQGAAAVMFQQCHQHRQEQQQQQQEQQQQQKQIFEKESQDQQQQQDFYQDNQQQFPLEQKVIIEENERNNFSEEEDNNNNNLNILKESFQQKEQSEEGKEKEIQEQIKIIERKSQEQKEQEAEQQSQEIKQDEEIFLKNQYLNIQQEIQESEGNNNQSQQLQQNESNEVSDNKYEHLQFKLDYGGVILDQPQEEGEEEENKIQNENQQQIQIQEVQQEETKNSQVEQQNHQHNHHHQHNHSSNQTEGGNAKDDQNKIISMIDLANILSMKFIDLNQYQDYDPVEKSISFKLNNRYTIKVKSCENISYEKVSYFHQIPSLIVQENLFTYFTAFELFKLRGVSKEWNEMVRAVWYKTFKREMYEQLTAADLCKEIEKEFKLVHLRHPFKNKLNVLLQAIIELINWDQLQQRIDLGNLGLKEKKILFCVQKILKLNNNNEELRKLQNLSEFEESHFVDMKENVILNLRQNISKIFDSIFMFETKSSLRNLKVNFLDYQDISISQFTGEDDKNFLLLVIYLKQCYVFALLKNYIFIVQIYIQQAKKKLDAISQQWPDNKGFLEGAYKILLLRNVKIRNNKICNEDSDNEEIKDNNDENNEGGGENLMKSLFNLQATNTEPDFVIKKKGHVTSIFIDAATKIDILLNYFVSFQNNLMDSGKDGEDKNEETETENNNNYNQNNQQNTEQQQTYNQLQNQNELISEEEKKKHQELVNELDNLDQSDKEEEYNREGQPSEQQFVQVGQSFQQQFKYNNNAENLQKYKELDLDKQEYQIQQKDFDQEEKKIKTNYNNNQMQSQNEQIIEIQQQFLQKFQMKRNILNVHGDGLKLILKKQ